jgi:hypothetical protein
MDSLADCGPGESDVLARMMLKVPELDARPAATMDSGR